MMVSPPATIDDVALAGALSGQPTTQQFYVGIVRQLRRGEWAKAAENLRRMRPLVRDKMGEEFFRYLLTAADVLAPPAEWPGDEMADLLVEARRQIGARTEPSRVADADQRDLPF